MTRYFYNHHIYDLFLILCLEILLFLITLLAGSIEVTKAATDKR